MWSSASGCRCTRSGGVRTAAAEPWLQIPERNLLFLCRAASSRERNNTKVTVVITLQSISEMDSVPLYVRLVLQQYFNFKGFHAAFFPVFFGLAAQRIEMVHLGTAVK